MQSNAKSENRFHFREIRPHGGFQLRNPNPDFMDFLFTVRFRNPKKDLQNYFEIVNSFDNYALACEQALCLGKNSEEREGKGGERALFAFPSPHPARLKACSKANYACAYKTAVLKDSFSNPFRIS